MGLSEARKEQLIVTVGKINKETFDEFGFLLNGVSEKELDLGRKIKSAGTLPNKKVNNQRGGMFQKQIIETPSDFSVFGGAQIGRYAIKGVKGHIFKKAIVDEKAYLKDKSILVQNIVAHIENPVDHIKITASMIKENSSKYVIIDTINQLENKSEFPSELILAVLNSKLMNWYCYRFIFGKAIRSMHFDNSVTERIPILDSIDRKMQEICVNLVDSMLSLNKKLSETKGEEDRKRIQKEIEKTDKEIDELVYKLYGITEEEKKIIEESLK